MKTQQQEYCGSQNIGSSSLSIGLDMKLLCRTHNSVSEAVDSVVEMHQLNCDCKEQIDTAAIGLTAIQR